MRKLGLIGSVHSRIWEKAAMSRTVFKLVSPSPTFEHFPVRVELAASGSAFSRVLLLLPAVAAITALLAGVAIAAAGDHAMLDAVTSRPLASIQIAAGLALWATLFVVPASRALATLWRQRVVSIGNEVVEISDRLLTGARLHRVPLRGYTGAAHHIRASLSGLTHEIVLVHANPALTVTIASAERITQGTLDAAKSLLQLPEVPAGAIYGRYPGPTTGADAAVLATARA